jgi:hypothetical protein
MRSDGAALTAAVLAVVFVVVLGLGAPVAPDGGSEAGGGVGAAADGGSEAGGGVGESADGGSAAGGGVGESADGGSAAGGGVGATDDGNVSFDFDRDGVVDLSQPGLEDPDEDGMVTLAERARGTPPDRSDADGDGLPDGVEVYADEALPGADPLRMDVFVEVDYASGCDLSDYNRERLQESFRTAPVDNPDGSRGVSLHLVHSNELPEDRYTGSREEVLLEAVTTRTFDHEDEGYHYVAMAYIGGGKNNGIFSAVECTSENVLMHELGHSMGLMPVVAEGIDNRWVPAEEYPSVMNYNTGDALLDYSAGGHGPDDHDDWGYLEDNLFTPPPQALCEQVGANSSECRWPNPGDGWLPGNETDPR